MELKDRIAQAIRFFFDILSVIESQGKIAVRRMSSAFIPL